MYFLNLGCGVFAKEDIEANTFLFEYEGKLLTKEEGMKILSSSSGPGYLFFFGKNHWYALHCYTFVVKKFFHHRQSCFPVFITWLALHSQVTMEFVCLVEAVTRLSLCHTSIRTKLE